jgi:hypothetical protein
VHKGQAAPAAADTNTATDPAIAQQHAAAVAAFQQHLEAREAAAKQQQQQKQQQQGQQPAATQQQNGTPGPRGPEQVAAPAQYFALQYPAAVPDAMGFTTNMNVSSLRTELPAPNGDARFYANAQLSAEQQPTAAGPPPASDAFVAYNQGQ